MYVKLVIPKQCKHSLCEIRVLNICKLFVRRSLYERCINILQNRNNIAFIRETCMNNLLYIVTDR
jgi:hypothetical protein